MSGEAAGDRHPHSDPGGTTLDRRLADAVERLAQAVRTLAGDTARAAGLSALQQQALLFLTRPLEGLHEVGALSAEFDVASPTMSDAVASLERKGLVARSPHAADRRRRRLTLTDAGHHAAAETGGWDTPLIEALDSVPAEQKAITLATLLAVIAWLQHSGVISVARTCATCRFFRPHRYPDPAAPHHCALLDQPLPLAGLRTDCPDHRQAS